MLFLQRDALDTDSIGIYYSYLNEYTKQDEYSRVATISIQWLVMWGMANAAALLDKGERVEIEIGLKTL